MTEENAKDLCKHILTDWNCSFVFGLEAWIKSLKADVVFSVTCFKIKGFS